MQWLPALALALAACANAAGAAPTAKGRVDELAGQLGSPASALRIKAADGLGELGPEATSAVPNLVRALTDPEVVVRNRAAAALGKIQEPTAQVVPALLARIEAATEEWTVRHNAAVALSWIGEPAVAGLKQRLTSAQPFTRAYAADALIRMKSGSGHVPVVLPVVESLLADKDTSVRAFAVQLVVKLGPVGKSTTPALIRLLDDPVGDVRVSAVKALISIGNEASGAIPRVLRVLKEDKEQWARIHATEFLAVAGGGREDVISALIGSFGDSKDRVGAYAAQALAKLGEPAVPGLLAVVKSTEKSSRQWALDALATMGPKVGGQKQSVAEALVTILEQEKEAAIRFRAAGALGFLGVSTPAVAAALKAATRDSDEIVRVNARDALKRLGLPEAVGPVPLRN